MNRLRQWAIEEVATNLQFYQQFLTRGNVKQWCRAMRRDGEWSDNLLVYAVVNVLQRPLLVWRVASEQIPTCVVPRVFDETKELQSIYLLLDETVPNSEHYSALLPANPEEPPLAPRRRLRS